MALSYQEVEIERRKIPLLIGLTDDLTNRGPGRANSERQEFERHWIAWQLYWRHHMTEMKDRRFPRAHAYPVIGILLVFPIAGSIGYTVFWALQNFQWGYLNLVWLIGLVMLNLAYVCLSYYGGVRSYRTLNKHFREKYGDSDGSPVVCQLGAKPRKLPQLPTAGGTRYILSQNCEPLEQ